MATSNSQSLRGRSLSWRTPHRQRDKKPGVGQGSPGAPRALDPSISLLMGYVPGGWGSHSEKQVLRNWGSSHVSLKNLHGGFLKWGYHPNHPSHETLLVSFIQYILILKPMVFSYPGFQEPPTCLKWSRASLPHPSPWCFPCHLSSSDDVRCLILRKDRRIWCQHHPSMGKALGSVTLNQQQYVRRYRWTWRFYEFLATNTPVYHQEKMT